MPCINNTSSQLYEWMGEWLLIGIEDWKSEFLLEIFEGVWISENLWEKFKGLKIEKFARKIWGVLSLPEGGCTPPT